MGHDDGDDGDDHGDDDDDDDGDDDDDDDEIIVVLRVRMFPCGLNQPWHLPNSSSENRILF